MSETIPMNDVPESNGMEQPAYNGETEEHAGKFTFMMFMIIFINVE